MERSQKEKLAPLSIKILRTTSLISVVLIIGTLVLGPITLMLDPAKRWERLTSLASPLPPLKSRSFSPLAEQLKNHVVFLTQTIGERAAYQGASRNKARTYVAGQFKKFGYEPKLIEYKSKNLYYVIDDTAFHNVEAILDQGVNPQKGILLVSAHYDTAPGTSGADDNTSGVAVLLELANYLKAHPIQREVRFVAFGTEEPPAFGTQNMGSFHYAQELQQKHVNVQGLINLEMVGYFNPKKGSQLYPPFLHMFFPNNGNFIAIVSNISSRTFLKTIKSYWPEANNLRMVSASLPTIFSGVTLSDQLNFWSFGFNAVMVTDTSFFRNPHYHQNTDTAEKLDYEKMALLITALTTVLTNI